MINIWVNNEACRRYFSIDFKCNLSLIPCNRKEVFLMFRALLHIALTSLRFLLHLSRCVTVKSKSNINLDLTFNLVLKIKHENTWKFWFDIKKTKIFLWWAPLPLLRFTHCNLGFGNLEKLGNKLNKPKWVEKKVK